MESKLELLARDIFDQIDICKTILKYDRVYIYGAGYVGKKIYEYFSEKGFAYKINSFVITGETENESYDYLGKRIQSIDNVEASDKDVFLIATKKNIRNELIIECKKRKFNYIEIYQYDDRNCLYYSQMPQEIYPLEISYWYRQWTGREIDIYNPKSFNEKIQWIKAFEDDKRKTRYTDKYLVREHVKETIGEEYLIPLIGVWDDFGQIPFESFPDKFVLKTTHGSSQNIIVNNKSKFDKISAQKQFKEWLNFNYAFLALERHYSDIKPQIIAEEYIEDEFHELLDYKIWCFDGIVKFIQVDIDRFTDHKRNLYTPRWDLLPYEICFEKSKKKLDKPRNLEEMISVAEKLSQGFNFVRVDLYSVFNHIFFGELTFTPGAGGEEFRPFEFGNMVGEWFKIS